uniref:Reverse transcriptase domain-containing protein n=1 Tax=Plectus sambesii TaxID=2011161 RepID=A0A914X6Y4_9BILA
MVLEGGTPGLEGTPQATREEQGRISSSSDTYDADWTNPLGHRPADAAPRERNRLRFTKVHNIGIWNVRGMNTGKLDIVKAEMEWLNIDILGISELHWIGSGYFNSDDYTVYYSRNDNTRRNGVSVILSKKVAKAVQCFNAINDRVMSIRLHGKPRSFTILQVYAPTTNAEEEDIERFYAGLQQAIDQAPAKDAILIAGDFNAKVGAGEEPPVAGRFGNRASQPAGQEDITKQEPDILDEEVAWALKQLPNRKAPGIDCIPAKLLKSVPIPTLTTLCRQIWKTKSWPKDWTRSAFVLLPKKGDTKDCGNYRTIALITHASKILLKIIQKRMASFVEMELPDVQAGFRKGRGTRDQIANLWWIMEKTREFQKGVYMCFIDYSKAFDCVEHDKLWKCLKQMDIPEHLVELIRSLYENQEATVRTAFGNTDWFDIERGVRQGCILSPALFNLYAETIMRRCDLDKSPIGVKIGGRNINNLRYADDTTLLAENERDLEYLVRRVKEENERMGLYLNVKKTKVMTTASNGTVRITIDNKDFELVQDFLFLGSKIDRGGDSGPEVKQRIALMLFPGSWSA